MIKKKLFVPRMMFISPGNLVQKVAHAAPLLLLLLLGPRLPPVAPPACVYYFMCQKIFYPSCPHRVCQTTTVERWSPVSGRLLVHPPAPVLLPRRHLLLLHLDWFWFVWFRKRKRKMQLVLQVGL